MNHHIYRKIGGYQKLEAITFTKMYGICQKEIEFTLKEKEETARIGML